MLNPFRRSFRLPGALGAGLVGGRDKTRWGYGNGDALLVDLRHRIFAVADAAERFPQASRLLLQRLAAAAAQKGAPRNEAEFQALIEEVWWRQRYIHSTTLSCVALVTLPDGPAALVAGNGDSTVSIWGSEGRAMLFQTAVDMNFAGRSRAPNPVTAFPLQPSRPLIVLATDGISGIGGLAAAALARRPHDLPGWMADRGREESGFPGCDDMAAIALVPEAIAREQREILLMGGTTPDAEADFRRARETGHLTDCWDTVDRWAQSGGVPAQAGIQIL